MDKLLKEWSGDVVGVDDIDVFNGSGWVMGGGISG